MQCISSVTLPNPRAFWHSSSCFKGIRVGNGACPCTIAQQCCCYSCAAESSASLCMYYTGTSSLSLTAAATDDRTFSL
jgi:hypothetical protein